MELVIGVRFNTAEKIYFFNPEDLDVKRGDSVIVETVRGIELGKVVLSPKELSEEEIVQPLKSIIRIATKEDIEQYNLNKEKAYLAFLECKRQVAKLDLDMKIVSAAYTFDGNKILFYFLSDDRVDFRELVKILAGLYKVRIELRQIGARESTKKIGALGICGRPLCCSSFLTDFIPVSIKMAREQNLSLNPTKISGICGRLMCCLSYEENVYKELNPKVPKVGTKVKIIATGEEGVVNFANVLREEIKVIVENNDDTEAYILKAEEVKVIKNDKS